MDKTFKILQVMHLFANRPLVTLDMIRKTCNIPRRTAFRYLNTLSGANIPIYYDRQCRAYRLNSQNIPSICDLAPGDVVIVLAALRLLRLCVNTDYQVDIDKLTTRILVRQSASVEEVLGTIRHRLDAQALNLRLSDLLSSVLIQTALSCGRGVKVTSRRHSRNQTTAEIQNPAIRFKKKWELVDNQTLEQDHELVENIRKVVIL